MGIFAAASTHAPSRLFSTLKVKFKIIILSTWRFLII